MRLRIYILISVILVVIVVYEIAFGLVPFVLALAGILLGVLLGIVTARMFRLSWDHDSNLIVARLDMFGGVIIALYILFAIFRSNIIGYFTHGSFVGGISIAVATGVMVGRVVGTRGRIMKILKEQNIS